MSNEKVSGIPVNQYRQDLQRMQQSVRSWESAPKVHPQFIHEMSRGHYEDSMMVCGEYAANAWDCDSLKFVTEVDSKSIVFEDWGPGMTAQGLDDFWWYFKPTKRLIEKTLLYGRPMWACRAEGGA